MSQQKAEDPIVIDGLKLLRAFNTIADPADRQRVIALVLLYQLSHQQVVSIRAPRNQMKCTLE
jgi:hypothetical protein